MEAALFGYERRRVVVTGAASGMGAAVTRLLVELGADVHAVDIQQVTAEGVAATYELDLADPDAVAAVAGEIAGPVHGLFNCAGLPGVFDPQLVFAVNFVGMRQLTELLLPKMTEGGAVCCIGSTSAVSWQRHLPVILEVLATSTPAEARAWAAAHLADQGYPYDFAKEVVNGYVAHRALTTIGDGIRLNGINPGGTSTASTPNFGKAMRNKEGGVEMLRAYPKLLGRLADPTEQAWPMIFLNSALASYVNGTCLYVDAGFTGGLFTLQYDPVVAKGMRWEPPSA